MTEHTGRTGGWCGNDEAAAVAQIQDILRIERHLNDALNSSGVLRSAIADDGDSRAMHADAVLAVIEKKLKKANLRLDGMRHAAGNFPEDLMTSEQREISM